MSSYSLLLATLVAFLALFASPSFASPIARASGTLELVNGKPQFTFHYATTAPHSKNWVGLYRASGGGPVNQTQDQNSLVWKYAPSSDGTVQLDPSGLATGAYTAFFLAKDGYQWLANPITVNYGSSPGGKLELVNGKPLFTFHYVTNAADSTNWVGLYRASGGGPVNQEKDQQSLVWKYATSSDGTVQLDPSGLPAGSYTAFFLAKDGYKWLANPITVDYSGLSGGTLELVNGKPLFTFHYATTAADATNWVGLYHASGGGPVNQEKDQQSLVWKYAPSADGTVQLDPTGLAAGAYTAFFLAKDGYKWLANPITVDYAGSSGGTLQLVSGSQFTFRYTTKNANSKNWIGLYYSSGGGPVNQKLDQQSLVWKYAPSSDGTVQLSPSGLTVGTYTVFFLANDGYQWLANPIDVTYAGPAGSVSWLADNLRLHNARQGNPYRANIRGLVKGGTTVTFSTANGGWAKISNDGVITGTPGTSASDTTFTVTATGAASGSATVRVTVPVRKAGTKLVEDLKVMTFNLWHGGSQVNNYHEKQVRFLANSGADVVGLQETTGAHALRIANALGWYALQGGDPGTISRYPIVATDTSLGFGQWARIALDGGSQQITLWNVHLGYTPYGPYDFCFDKLSVAQTLQNEERSNRTPQIKATIAAMQADIARAASVPVLLVGDFNAPSHLDYTDALKQKNCGYSNVPWPTSVLPTNATLRDSFRVANPDPAAVQGITWSPIYLRNGNRAEPMDRIDFIYYKGGIGVVDSKTLVVGSPAAEPNHANNEWTSDHAAVMTTFRLP